MLLQEAEATVEKGTLRTQGTPCVPPSPGSKHIYLWRSRTRTFPIYGFQICDGPVRFTKCTFGKFTPTSIQMLLASSRRMLGKRVPRTACH
ncbi:uncharacterized protein [Anolis sagrei]|uniref:uncharacterized protein isoform X2 n=1 Tax=Anolis sagrei TaxID=38937 RepID=UPI0035205723